MIIGGAELTRNSGASAGAVTIINLNSPMNSSVHLLNSVFYENAKFTVSKCHGTAMQYYWFQEQNKKSIGTFLLRFLLRIQLSAKVFGTCTTRTTNIQGQYTLEFTLQK